MSCLSLFIAVENIIPTNLVKIIIIIRCIVIVEILSNYAVAKPPFRNWSFRKRIKHPLSRPGLLRQFTPEAAELTGRTGPSAKARPR